MKTLSNPRYIFISIFLLLAVLLSACGTPTDPYTKLAEKPVNLHYTYSVSPQVEKVIGKLEMPAVYTTTAKLEKYPNYTTLNTDGVLYPAVKIETELPEILRVSESKVFTPRAEGCYIGDWPYGIQDTSCYDKIADIDVTVTLGFSSCDLYSDDSFRCRLASLDITLTDDKLILDIKEGFDNNDRQDLDEFLSYMKIEPTLVPVELLSGGNYEIPLP